jgi:L-2,4-diaminobutyrate transaminase
VELIADRDTGAFFDPDQKIGPQIAGAMLSDSSVIARAMPQGDIVGFAPPFCLTKAEADRIVGATQKAIKSVLG